MGHRCWMELGFQRTGIDWESLKWKQEKWLELWGANNKKCSTSEENTDQFIQEQHWKLDLAGMGLISILLWMEGTAFHTGWGASPGQ